MVEYKKCGTKVKIICGKHGMFEQSPTNHLNGEGCPKCSNKISKPEIKWLDELNVKIEHRNKTIKLKDGSVIRPDGYDISTNTIYEFYGDYWHGNPSIFNPDDINKRNKKTYGKLFEDTMKREQLIKESGYNLITIWESDYNAGIYTCKETGIFK